MDHSGVKIEGPAIARIARDVVAAEIHGLRGLEPLFESPSFIKAADLLFRCRGRILISGLGKSGLAGQRIAASLRSTGSPAVFIHPVEAVHGDLGVVAASDVAILMSKSGENPEVSSLIPTFRRLGVAIIGMTTARDSEIGRCADVLLDLGKVAEISPLPEVPIVSTLLFQAVGDALTVILYRLKGFTAEDFAFLHPGGVLGRSVTLRVKDVMHRGSDLPVVTEETLLVDALVEIMEKRIGMTCVVSGDKQLAGILTDGDFKRILHRWGGSIQNLRVGEVMTRNPHTIDPDELLVTALKEMETNQPGAITALVVVDAAGCPEGVVHIHDCLRMSAAPTR